MLRSFSRNIRMASSLANSMIAVCQMTSTSNKESNMKITESLIEEASMSGAKVVFFPECFDYVGENKEQSIELAEPIIGNTIRKLRNLAKEKKIWMSLGGFHEKGPDHEPNKVYNSHLLIDDSGDIKAVYRKTHLFDVDIKGGAVIKESDYVIPGKELIPPVRTPVGNISLQVCYDIRFPEMSCVQAQMGAEILTFPSAFTVMTGMAHWETLLRARAIDNQCYVVAAAQCGQHTAQRRSYGHAMVIDPWGTVMAQCSEGVGFCLANLDMQYLKNVRSSIPLWDHRRYDLYQNPLKNST